VNYNSGAHTLSFHVRILLFTVLLNNVDGHRRVTTLVMHTSSALPSLRPIWVLTPLREFQHLQVFTDGWLITSSSFVYLTNVGNHDHQGIFDNFRCYQCTDIKVVANADIWSLDGNQLTATWKNSDGTTAPVHFCLNSAGDSIVLAGDPSLLPAGYKEVVCSLPTFDRVIFANPCFQYFNLDK
jgi:hypothetical protein